MKCPIDNGALLPWGKPPNKYPWFCPNNDYHGGNGQFYTNEDLEAFRDVDDSMFDKALAEVLEGTLTFDDAVTILARRHNKPEPMIRARLASSVRFARNYRDMKQTPKKSGDNSGDKRPAAGGSANNSRGGTVTPDVFMAVLQQHKLTKKQAAEAIGRSVSRVHELTVTKGGSEALLENFKAALEAYAKGH